MDDKILHTLRAQAWERAKGELQAVLQTYWDGPDNSEKFDAMSAAVRNFIEDVEGDGLAE